MCLCIWGGSGYSLGCEGEISVMAVNVSILIIIISRVFYFIEGFLGVRG